MNDDAKPVEPPPVEFMAAQSKEAESKEAESKEAESKEAEPKEAHKGGAVAERPDIIDNVPLHPRPKPKTTRDYIEEFVKTGNPAAWIAMRAMEPRFEFAPGYVRDGQAQTKNLLKPKEYGLKGFREFDLHLSTGEDVTAWYKAAKKGFPTLVYCHGNAGGLDYRSPLLQNLTDSPGRGFGVIIAAYPGFKGHHDRPGIEASEIGCNATGHAMVRHLINSRGIPMDKIVLFGESLGGAVALRTAQNIQNGIHVQDGVFNHHYEPEKAPPTICFNTFTSLVKRAKEQFPMLPASTLMTNRFESDQIIADINSPILLMHGKADDYTHYHHSVDLQKASQGKAELKLLDGVTHSCNHPETSKIDGDQLDCVIDCAQEFMHKLNLCPPPPVRVKGANQTQDNARPKGQTDWEHKVSDGERVTDIGM